MEYAEVLTRVQRENLPVEIIYTDENGEWKYAIAVGKVSWLVGGDNYWLEAFDLLRDARKFCQDKKLNYAPKVQYPYGTKSYRNTFNN